MRKYYKVGKECMAEGAFTRDYAKGKEILFVPKDTGFCYVCSLNFECETVSAYAETEDSYYVEADMPTWWK